MPDADSILCPVCKTPIRMTLQGALRARDLGVAVECTECGGGWLYRSVPVPEFGPLITPKRRRGRTLEPPGDEPDDLDRGDRE